MNTNYPHEIIPETELKKLPTEEQKTFIRVPSKALHELEAMSPDQRAQWLKDNPVAAIAIEKAKAKRERKNAD